MKRRNFLLGTLGAVAAPAITTAASPAKAKTAKKEEVVSVVEREAMPKEGLFSVKPHLQLMGEREAAVVWMTRKKATGFVEWSQDDGATWTKTWTEEDGLLDAGCTLHRTILSDFDPSRPIRFRICSQENPYIFPYRAEFKGDIQKMEFSLDPILPANGKVAFAMFNDVHQHLENYPKLLDLLPAPVNFSVFAGDIMNHVDDEAGLSRYLLAPLSYVCTRTRAAMWYVRGNHECRGPYSRKLRNYLALPDGHYFGAVTLGAARIVFIDTGEDKENTHHEFEGIVDFDAYLERQMKWLRKEFASDEWKNAKFRIAVMHIPPVGTKMLAGHVYNGESNRMRKMTELLKTSGLTIAFAAHTHRSGNDDARPDRPYVVITGGGNGIASPEKSHWKIDATITHCQYDANELVVTQVNMKGEKLFERRIKA